MQIKTKYILYSTKLKGHALNIVYNYNNLKQITAIEIQNPLIYYSNFSYTPNGEVEHEHYFPNSVRNFTRFYS